jgi:hypothetical protein
MALSLIRCSLEGRPSGAGADMLTYLCHATTAARGGAGQGERVGGARPVLIDRPAGRLSDEGWAGWPTAHRPPRPRAGGPPTPRHRSIEPSPL